MDVDHMWRKEETAKAKDRRDITKEAKAKASTGAKGMTKAIKEDTGKE